MARPGPGMGGAPFLHEGWAAGRRGGGAVSGPTEDPLGGESDVSPVKSGWCAVSAPPPRRPAARLSTTSAPPNSICCRRYLRHSSDKGLLPYVENCVRHLSLRLQRENLAGAVPGEKGDAVGVLLESGTGLQRVVDPAEVEPFELQ